MKKTTPVLSSSSSSSSPAMSPDDNDNYNYLHLVGDKRYALHGKILMLVLVLGFSLFLVLLVALPCLKRRNSRDTDESQRRWCFIRQKKKPTSVDDDDDDDGDHDEASGGTGNVERHTTISRKCPL
ncbi:hypothetical protein ACOSP7_025168 [Xanthoceras sorbifolium]